MPGVLIKNLHKAAVLRKNVNQIGSYQQIIYLMSIEKAHFRKPVVPGDKMYIHIKQVQARRNIWKMSGEAKVDNEVQMLFFTMLVKE